jgi:hypothetical protein
LSNPEQLHIIFLLAMSLLGLFVLLTVVVPLSILICLPCIGFVLGGYESDEADWAIYRSHDRCWYKPRMVRCLECFGDVYFRLFMSARHRDIRAKKRREYKEKEG